MSSGLLPPDQPIRRQISEDLERNILVEAGAGSGKTKALVDRMVALIRRRVCSVEQIAAVTFTRKAAAELRQRFQEELEQVAERLLPEDPVHKATEEAIRNLDGAFLGTIHAFCAKLLRERPLEAGLDPGFRELLESEAYRTQRAFWIDFLEHMGTTGDLRLNELEILGIAPDRLQGLFDRMVENPDVDFGFRLADPPNPQEIASVRARFEKLLDRAEALMPTREPEGGWDPLARRVRTVLYWRRSLDWGDGPVFFDALAKFREWKGKPVQKRWSGTPRGKAAAKRLGEDFRAFGEARGQASRLLESWWAYLYPKAVSVAKSAADAFAQERKDRGMLTFQDLLTLSAELLRDNSDARRDLGNRYRRILVDEFQDTDPLQAEVLFLLASKPGPPDKDAETGEDWRSVIPRAGALFVVGDPKQSIYRFRRADISLYEFVKQRFRAFGSILRLEANFRSRPAIQEVVAGVFDREEMFPKKDTDAQAAFAPLLAQRGREPGAFRGTLVAYRVEGKKKDEIARDDAARIATSIAQRVGSGERKAGDFMILTRNRSHLSVYARSLEDRNLPVEVSGAGIGFEEELAAFLLLFRCLSDPTDSVRILGVLGGPFFGISLDQIGAHKDGGGSLSFTRPPQDDGSPPRGDSDVAEALATLHGWWKRSRREPADITAERLVRATGLFPLAAGGPLGQLRAGTLVYLLDAVRARALAGDTSLAGAVEAIETALAWSDAEAPLVPSRGDAIQVMNLHRAKGLEGRVVFLASPFGERVRSVDMRITRGGDGVALGTIPVVERARYHTRIIARPSTWEADEAEEKAFVEAEKKRLLYVAVTRARDELWVARGKSSPWADIEKWLVKGVGTAGEAGSRDGRTPTNKAGKPNSFAVDVSPEAPMIQLVDLPPEPPPDADLLDPETNLAGPTATAEAAVHRARIPGYNLATVTARARGEDTVSPKTGMVSGVSTTVRTGDFPLAPLPPADGGLEWGSVVHAALAAAGSGAEGDSFARIARDLLVEYERPTDSHGHPAELEALLTLVASVRESDVWARAMASKERYTEMPFAVNRSGESGPPEVLEGVIDLVFKEGNRWIVADYKTDVGRDPAFRHRLRSYRAQVDLYATCWEEITGNKTGERILIFPAQGRTESW